MPGNDSEARFSIPIDSNAAEVGEEGAASLEKLKEQIRGSTDLVRQMSAAQRSLKGSTEEIKNAREELKGKIQAERAALSAANLAILKQGTTYEKLAQTEREAAKEKEKLAQATASERREALSLAGGPLKQLVDMFGDAKSVLGGSAGFVFLVAASAAAIVALSAAAAAGVAALGRWVVSAANANRAMALMREAAGGSAKQAEAMGTQVDALARKVPTSTEALNELQTSLVASLLNSRVSGQGIEDTFAAVGQAASAMGDQAGNALRGIIERGKQFGRVGIGLNELESGGTGLKLGDVAEQLATQMHVGVDKARQSLVYGLVPIDAGAKAIRDAVEKRFGEVNAKKLLDLNVIAQKFHDRLTKLASGFNLTPVLESLSKLADMFDLSTVTGSALQQMISVFGTIIGGAFKSGTPIVQTFFEKLVIGAQQGVIWTLKLALFVKTHFEAIKVTLLGVASAIVGTLGAALIYVTPLLWGLAAPVLAATWPFLAIGAAVGALAIGIYELVKHWGEVKAFFSNLGASAVQAATDFVSGLVGGLAGGVSRVVEAATNLGKEAWQALKSVWKSNSPSKLAFGLGADIGEGKALGIESKSGRVADAAASSGAAGAGAMAGGGGGGGGAGATYNFGPITVIVQGGGANATQQGQEAARSFYAEAVRLFDRLAQSEGIPTQAAPT